MKRVRVPPSALRHALANGYEVALTGGVGVAPGTKGAYWRRSWLFEAAMNSWRHSIDVVAAYEAEIGCGG